jgi:hypothetical protein
VNAAGINEEFIETKEVEINYEPDYGNDGTAVPGFELAPSLEDGAMRVVERVVPAPRDTQMVDDVSRSATSRQAFASLWRNFRSTAKSVSFS